MNWEPMGEPDLGWGAALQPVRRARTLPQGFDVADIFEALPEAVYMTDAAGRITFYNRRAVELWGIAPALGTTAFPSPWRLYWPDDRPLPHGESPMDVALRDRSPSRGLEIVAERPDGIRVSILAFATPLLDEDGVLIGAINMLVDLTDSNHAFQDAQRLAAIVESSSDAILTKDLEGTITSWNPGAEHLFGYTAEETVGRPITMLIPADRLEEETDILARIRRGERLDHFETIRRRKDGSLVEISLTVSPVKNRNGRIVGASKIARDITERRRAEEQQHLLIREMDHRVKNLFALASGVVGLSARSADSVEDLAATVRARLSSLARAHALTIPNAALAGDRHEMSTTLHRLIRTIAEPYQGDAEAERLRIEGPDVPVSGSAVTSFALLLHEFATNAAKYGALSVPGGSIVVACRVADEAVALTWVERGGPDAAGRSDGEGFGSLLAKATVRGQLGGEIVRDWRPEGLTIHLTAARDRLG